MSRLFPIELLEDSKDARLMYFAHYTIEHTRLKQATKQLRQAINSRVKESIVFVYGPAGVGKTTLCEHVVADIIRANLAVADGNQPKAVPVAFVDAATPDNNRFDWKDFYQHSIYSIESSMSKKLHPKFIRYNPRLAPALYFNQNLKPCEYRSHFISALRKYLPAAFFIDEAQHLAKVTSADKLLNQMDIIKTIAKFSATKIVLVGPYDLLPFRNLSGQLSRRSWDVHFSRYTTARDDLIEFKSAILTLQRKLPLIAEPDLIKHWKYIYTKSVGCVGTMKDWFLRALETAVGENEKTISFDMLRHCALSDNQSTNIALEINDGERLVNGDRDSFEKLEKLVGFKSKNPGEVPPPKENPLLISPNTHQRFGTPRVGRRKARRDATG